MACSNIISFLPLGPLVPLEVEFEDQPKSWTANLPPVAGSNSLTGNEIFP
jgi:hypothetical protein